MLYAERVIHIRRPCIVRRHCTRSAASIVKARCTHWVRLAAVNNDIAEHVNIHVQLKATSAHRRHLTQNDILANTLAVINVTHHCSLEQDFHSLLECASHESALAGTVYTMAGNRHERALARHDINKECNVAVVDVRTIKLNNIADLLEQ